MLEKFRSMNDEELETLQQALEQRKTWPMEERAEFPVPPAVHATIAGALYWLFSVMRSDNPAVLYFGCLGLLLVLLSLVLPFF